MQKPGKRFGILMTFSLVIMLAMGLYFIYTQNVKEAKVKHQAFKTLYRYAGDIKEKEKEERIAEINRGDEEYRDQTAYRENLKLELQNIEDSLIIIEDEYYLLLEGEVDDKDSVDVFKRLNELEVTFYILFELSDEIYDQLYELEYQQEKSSNLDLLSDESDYLLYRFLQSERRGHKSWHTYANKVDTVIIHKEKLFKGLFDKNLFSGFIVFDSSKVIYNQFPYTNLELNLNKDKQSFRLDTLMHLFSSHDKVEVSLNGGSSEFGVENPSEIQIPISIRGKDYQLFMVKVDGVNIRYLAALMDSSKYASLKRGFDRGLISAITVFVLLLLFSIPIIKLFVVAPGEVYTIRSLITLMISSIGVIFIIAYFILYQSNLIYVRNHVKEDGEHLHRITDTIKQSFVTEVSTMLVHLNEVDSTLSEYLNVDSVKQQIVKQERYLKDFISTIDLLSEDTVFWLDLFLARDKEFNELMKNEKRMIDSHNILDRSYPKSYGNIIDILHNNFRYTNIDTAVGIDVRKRDYFLEPARFKKGDFEFGMQSIFSLTSAQPQVIISTQIDDSGLIVCLASELSSISNTILPYGYSFCIVDKDGRVWFHQNTKNNIRENLFTETDHHPDLIAAIHSHRMDILKVDYKMKPTMMRVEPLDNDLGLYIVTMCDSNNYTQMINQSGYIIIGAFIVILLFWLALIWVYKIWRFRNQNINNPPHLLLYLFPSEEYAPTYLRLAMLNIAIFTSFIVATLCFIQSIKVIHWIVLMAFVGLSLLVWNIRILLKDKKKNKTSSILELFVLPAVMLFCVDLVFPHIQFEESFWWTLVLLNLFNGLMYLLVYMQSQDLKLKGKLVERFCKSIIINWEQANTRLNLKSKYFVYTFTLILSFVFLPLISTYTVVFRQESTLHYMHQQRYIADQIILKRDFLKDQENKANIIPILEKEGNYYECFHSMKFCETSSLSDKDSCWLTDKTLSSTNNYIDFFGQARANMFFLNNLIEDRGNRVKPGFIDSDDKKRSYTYHINGEKLLLGVKDGGLPHNRNAFIISMDRPRITYIWKRYLGIVYGFFALLILFSIYFPKIALYLFPQFKYDRQLFTSDQSKHILHHPQSGERRYVVSMPDRVFYENCLQQNGSKLYRLHIPSDLENFLDLKSQDAHLYLFMDHMSFKGVNQLNRFVSHIENLLTNQRDYSINIVCFRVPRVLIQHFRESLISSLRKDNKKTIKKQMLLDTTLQRFINSLAYFSMSYVPILEQPLKTNVTYSTNNKKLIWLKKELGENAFLQDKYKLFERQETLSENEDYPFINEDNVYQAYLINRTYYQKIWDSCSHEEKSILFDIAEDYVINLHKNGVVNILINKGLIKNGQYLKLFNLSFTLFVNRQGDEVDEINAELRSNSKAGWSQYSLPLKLLGVAIVVFLLITQQEFLTNMQSILISVGAILTFAIRFFNFPIKTGIGSSE